MHQEVKVEICTVASCLAVGWVGSRHYGKNQEQCNC
jgi:hypothetical protein